MTDIDKHEWASGVHAGLFSLAAILAAVFWRSGPALMYILIAQALAYLGWLAFIMGWTKTAAVISCGSVPVAVYAAILALEVSA